MHMILFLYVITFIKWNTIFKMNVRTKILNSGLLFVDFAFHPSGMFILHVE